MVNKKLGFIFAVGILSLAACGEEEQSNTTDNPVEEAAVQESENSTTEEPTTETAEEAITETTEEEASTEEAEEEPNSETTEEEASTEEAEEATEEEPVKENSPEAASGAASELLSKGDSTSFVFNETGEFNIFCEPHPVMKMTVVVEDGAEQSEEVAIDIADYEFGEETITIAPGTTIVWTNQDQAQHNVAIK